MQTKFLGEMRRIFFPVVFCPKNGQNQAVSKYPKPANFGSNKKNIYLLCFKCGLLPGFQKNDVLLYSLRIYTPY